MEKNPHIEFKFHMKRGAHPYINSTYINGYIKDQPLRNYGAKAVLDEFYRLRNSCKQNQRWTKLISFLVGRKHIQHGGKRVYGGIKSIQGMKLGIVNR